MSRKNQQRKPSGSGFNNMSASFEAMQAQLTAAKLPASAEASLEPNHGRFFFMLYGAPPSEMHATFCQMAGSKWLDIHAGYWSDLAIRHRACQLGASLEGQEFLRWLAISDLSQQIGENHAFMSLAPWVAPLSAENTLMDIAVRFVLAKTTISDLNAHVFLRDMFVFIPMLDGVSGGPVTDIKKADELFPVGQGQVLELQVFAKNTLLRGLESFCKPHVYDTKDMIVDQMRSATMNSARGARPDMDIFSGGQEGQQKFATLMRRGNLSRSSFFQQATVRGLDHMRRFPR